MRAGGRSSDPPREVKRHPDRPRHADTVARERVADQGLAALDAEARKVAAVGEETGSDPFFVN